MRAFDASTTRRLRITCGCIFGSLLRAPPRTGRSRAGSIHESRASLPTFFFPLGARASLPALSAEGAKTKSRRHSTLSAGASLFSRCALNAGRDARAPGFRGRVLNFLPLAPTLYARPRREMTTKETVPEEKSRPSFRVKLAVVASSLVVGLLIFELFLRAVGFTYPVFYEPDASRGYALRPGMAGWDRKEGEAFVRINSDGLRDREHTKEKPADTLRVAVVGDSYAEAFQVAQEKAFWAVMERRLQDCPALGGRRVEVINFGVSGYGTAQELITLREKVWEYSPDVVLLAVTTNNDVLDNSRALKLTDEIPYFTLRGGQN